MIYPRIIFVRVAESYIYLSNILKWAKDNPEIKDNFSGLNIDVLSTELDRITDSFKTEFANHQGLVLEHISKCSGFEWREDLPVIYVYPTPFFNSFSHPLFLRICRVINGKIIPRDKGTIMGLLIHELAHNNLGSLNVDRELNETLINYLSSLILDKINPEYKSQFDGFHRRLNVSTDYSSLPLEIKDNKTSFRDFYGEKSSLT